MEHGLANAIGLSQKYRRDGKSQRDGSEKHRWLQSAKMQVGLFETIGASSMPLLNKVALFRVLSIQNC